MQSSSEWRFGIEISPVTMHSAPYQAASSKRFLSGSLWLAVACALLSPCAVTARGDLGADERATIELFEKSRDSVVYITTKAAFRPRRPWRSSSSGRTPNSSVASTETASCRHIRKPNAAPPIIARLARSGGTCNCCVVTFERIQLAARMTGACGRSDCLGDCLSGRPQLGPGIGHEDGFRGHSAGIGG
jgi:hypothetical protein